MSINIKYIFFYLNKRMTKAYLWLTHNKIDHNTDILSFRGLNQRGIHYL
jgi:hypothetical protein